MNPIQFTLVFFLAGVLGSALRAALTTSQEFLSRKSVVDIVVGGLVGGLYPLYPLIPLTGNWLQQAMEVAVISYFAGDVIQNAIMNRWTKAQAMFPSKP